MQWQLRSRILCLQAAAAEALTYACNHCHKDAAGQKMRILQFLIPVQMLLGKLPSVAIRHKYNMHIYDTIIEVIHITVHYNALHPQYNR